MQVQSKEDLLRQLAANSALIGNFGVQRFGLFGSFAKGSQDADSDVDLLVEFKPGRKSFDNFMNLAFFLEDLLGRKVDLVTPESLSPHIGPKILAEVEYGVID
jgi:predicted nucleotidyltransferase